jgi:hypothetical protein
LYLFIYLFIIVAEWSVVIAAFVLSMGCDLTGQTQNMKFSFERFEGPTLVLLRIQFFWDVMLRRLVNSYHFRGGYCCHIRDANVNLRGSIFYKLLQILTYADSIDVIVHSQAALKEA